MTSEERGLLRGLIDNARRARLTKVALEDGYCLNCWAELPDRKGNKKFCCDKCRRRYWEESLTGVTWRRRYDRKKGRV